MSISSFHGCSTMAGLPIGAGWLARMVNIASRQYYSPTHALACASRCDGWRPWYSPNFMHTEVLTPAATELIPSLSAFKPDFYLAGGTGLALQIGHRVSVDFDLFSGTAIKRTLIKNVEELYPKQTQEILVSSRNELTLMIGGVKFTFLHYPFPLILPLNTSGPIPILAVKEILATKAYTIGRRGEF